MRNLLIALREVFLRRKNLQRRATIRSFRGASSAQSQTSHSPNRQRKLSRLVFVRPSRLFTRVVKANISSKRYGWPTKNGPSPTHLTQGHVPLSQGEDWKFD